MEDGGRTYEVYCGEHVDKEGRNEHHPEGDAALTRRYGFEAAWMVGIAGLGRRVDIIDHVSTTEQRGRRTRVEAATAKWAQREGG